jgi:hypothetical protein
MTTFGAPETVGLAPPGSIPPSYFKVKYVEGEKIL